jgi:hypothetical protein
MNRLMRFLLILGGAVVVALTFSFPVWRPFFVNDTVAEVFPGLTSDQQTAFLALPPDVQKAYQELSKTNAALASTLVQAVLSPNVEVSQVDQSMPAMTDPTVIATGVFSEIDVIHSGSGNVLLYQLPDNSRIMRFENFRVTNAPELHVYLTRNPAPRTLEEIGNDYIDLGPLVGNVGSQNYTVPAEVDFSQYQGVVIYSPVIAVIFSTANIS